MYIDNYTPYEINLANELTEKLNDPGARVFYLQCARNYNEEFLRDCLVRALSVKAENVFVSRGAIFTSLLKHAPDGARSER